MEYLLIKWIHVLSSVLLFGIGLGSAFYKFMADRSGHLNAITHTNKTVVLADWIFTTPTIVMQPLTGLLLANHLDLPLNTPWISISLGLFIIAGLCWLPVVWLQIRMRNLSSQALAYKKPLGNKYHQYQHVWFWLGVPAFSSIIVVFYLMIFKPVITI